MSGLASTKSERRGETENPLKGGDNQGEKALVAVK